MGYPAIGEEWGVSGSTLTKVKSKENIVKKMKILIEDGDEENVKKLENEENDLWHTKKRRVYIENCIICQSTP